MTDNKKNPWETLTEEIEVAGHQLIEKVTALVAEGNVRKLRVRSKNDDVVLEIPLTAGAVAGGVVVIAAPFLAVLGTMAGLLAKVRIEVVRDVEKPTDMSKKGSSKKSGTKKGKSQKNMPG